MLGQTIGSYRVLSALGQGGMGVVYKALDERLGRPVALKLLPPDVTHDAQGRRRFQQEARAASALNDPHIVTIYDIFEHGGRDVLVMEYVPGRTLREAIQSGPVAIADAIDWIAQVAEGLALAHAAGIVHRDLKPGNLMLTDRGLIKVLDFGLAKLTRYGEDQATFDAPATQAGALLGTVDYMSPEQARGEPVDHRTDIFSLGAVAYELLTGQRPFRGAHTAALLHDILYGTIAAPRSLRADVSPRLEAIVLRALERDPSRRIQTMESLALELRGGTRASRIGTVDESLLESDATTPARESAGASAPPRKRVFAVGLALGAALLIGWAGTGPVQRWLEPSEGMPAPAAVAEPVTAFDHTQVGLGLLRRFDREGAVDKAIASLEKGIALDANYAPGWAALARAYGRQQAATRDKTAAARALDAARRAVQLDPVLADGHVSLGLAQMAAGDLAAAKAAFDQALVLDPRNAEAHRGVGQLADTEGRYADALSSYQAASALDDTNWEYPRLLGTVHVREGRYAEARAAFERASVLAPDAAAPFSLIGVANHYLGDYGAAAQAFQKSIAIRPSAAAYTNLGTALFFQGAFLEAVPAFEKAVEMNPGEPVNWGNLGDAYKWAPGQAAKARDPYLRAVQLLDTRVKAAAADDLARSRLALYLAKLGEAPRALAEAGRFTKAASSPDILFRVALTRELSGDRAGALEALEAALSKGYAMREVSVDPELSKLRTDARYHRLVSRFEPSAPPRSTR